MSRIAALTRTAITLAAIVLAGIGPFAAPALAQSPDVAACRDGTCTLTATGPVEIPLDGRAGFTALSVGSVGPYGVTFGVRRADRPGFEAVGVVGAGGTSRFGSGTGTLAVHVRELTDGTAQLELTTTVR